MSRSPPAFPPSKSAPDDISSSTHLSSDVSSKPVGSRSLMTSWPGKFGKGKTQNSNLTVENLHEFNRRNAQVEARYSPYYKGLTDFSLVIDREKRAGLNLSPGRESHAGSFISSGTAKSSFVVKVQEWGFSCFFFSLKLKLPEKISYSLESSWPKPSGEAQSTDAPLPSSSSSKVTENGAAIRTKMARTDPKSGKKVTFHSLVVEKPLREKYSEAPPMLPLSPPLIPPPESFPCPLPHLSPPVSPQQPESILCLLPQILPPPEPIPYLPLAPPSELLPRMLPPPESLAYPEPQISRALVSSPPTPLSSESPLPFFDAPSILPTQVLRTSSLPLVQELNPQYPNGGGCNRYENKEINTTLYERIYIWSDNYRPLRLQDFLCNRNLALLLQSMVRNWHEKAEECKHFIVEGNPGVGKRTMIRAMLREAFGQDNVKAKEVCKQFYLKGEAVNSITVNLKVSPQHVEVDVSKLKGYEKNIIVELIKEKNVMSDTSSRCNPKNCTAVILYGADKLSIENLSYIKWMLEKIKGCNKVLFCCRDARKLEAIKPLCTYVKLFEPTLEEILKVLEKIAREEKIQLPQQLAKKIAYNSKNNLRQAIRSFEATWHFNGCPDSLMEDQVIKNGWEDKIAEIAKKVIEEQSPQQLYNIRREVENLLEHNVDTGFIFQALKEELTKILPEHLQPRLVYLYDIYQKKNAIRIEEGPVNKREYDQTKNVQQFIRIEEFIARFMSCYKSSVTKNREV